MTETQSRAASLNFASTRIPILLKRRTADAAIQASPVHRVVAARVVLASSSDAYPEHAHEMPSYATCDLRRGSTRRETQRFSTSLWD